MKTAIRQDLVAKGKRSNWGKNGSLGSPAAPDTLINDFIVNSKSISRLRDGHRFVCNGNPVIDFLVICLLFASCPSAVRSPTILLAFVAVAAPVTLIIISAIKSHPLWPCAHIRQKLLKVLLPSATHVNTASAVSFKGFALRIGASVFSRKPYRIFGCHPLPSGIPVLQSFLSGQGSLFTTATCTSAAPKRIAMNVFFGGVRTVTLAKPKTIADVFQNGPVAEESVSQIDTFRHNWKNL